MATITKKPVVGAVKKAVASDGFQIVDIDTIEFLPSGRGGGKPMNPQTAKLIESAFRLKVGQGFKIPQGVRVERVIQGANGQRSTLYTYQGAVTLSKRAKAQGMRFRTRRDVNSALWLFRVEPLPVASEEGSEE